MNKPHNQLVSLELRMNAQSHADAANELLRKLLKDTTVRMSEEVRDDLILIHEDLHRVCVYLKMMSAPQTTDQQPEVTTSPDKAA